MGGSDAAATALLSVDQVSRRWAALGVLLVGAFLPPLDFFVVNVALPSIRVDLAAGSATIQLVISGYASAYAVFLITGGRLGDRYGRRRVFLFGMAAFAIASALCGFAWSSSVLVIGRIFQGLAAAAMAPQSLASIHALFSQGEKARALGIYGSVFGLASVIGQLLGGALVSANPLGLGWRSVFLVNLPIVATAFVTAFFLVRETRVQHAPALDLSGLTLSALGLGAIILPLIEGREAGWPWWAFASLAAAPLLLRLFWRHEQRLARLGRDPLVQPGLLRVPGLIRGLISAILLYSLSAFFLTLSVYLQAGLDRSPLAAGLAILPFGIGLFLGPLVSPLAVRLLRSGAPPIGMMIEVAGLMAAAAAICVVPGMPPNSLIFDSGLFAIGFGQGIALPTLLRALVDRVEPRQAGLAAGAVHSALQVGAALGVAIVGGVFYVALGTRTDPASFAYAFALALLCLAGLLTVAAAFARTLGPEPAHSLSSV